MFRRRAHSRWTPTVSICGRIPAGGQGSISSTSSASAWRSPRRQLTTKSAAAGSLRTSSRRRTTTRREFRLRAASLPAHKAFRSVLFFLLLTSWSSRADWVRVRKSRQPSYSPEVHAASIGRACFRFKIMCCSYHVECVVCALYVCASRVRDVERVAYTRTSTHVHVCLVRWLLHR